MENNFKKNSTLDQRKKESNKISMKYPDRIPIIVEKHHLSDINTIDKSKYLVPKDMIVSQFYFVIRKRIKLTSEKALFITVNGSLIPSNSTIGEIYDNMKDEDDFLYVLYTGENTFG